MIPPRGRVALGALGLGLSLACLYAIPDGEAGVLPFLGVMLGASLSFGLAAHAVVARRAPIPLWAVLLGALAFHALLIPTGPHYDDDLYRYTWDGKVLAAGENPYAHPPNDLDLIELWRKDQYKIPYDHVSTIYPPATQGVFFAAALVAPDSFVALKVAFSALNLALLGMIVALLRQLGRPPTWALVYGWNPLVLKEVADSGHMDPWMMLWLMGALSLSLARRPAASVVAWTGAVLCKLVPLALGPLLLARLPRKAWILLSPALIALAYLPFVEEGAHLFGGLETYGRYWVFNPGLFQAVEGALRGMGITSAEAAPGVARGIAAAAVAVVAALLARRITPDSPGEDVTRAALLTLGALLLVAPTVDPWYLMWIAPLVALHPTAAGVVFTLAPALSYGYYLGERDPTLLRGVEYTLIYGSLGASLGLRLLRRPRVPASDSGAA